jgi:outer membrane protein assembly factor BamE (lipoprotein component of BamABCDE complex)
MASIRLRLAAVTAAGVLLVGCAGIRDHKGFVLDKELASAVQVGVDNKDSVLKSLGRPTFTGQFDANDWYYLSRDVRTMPLRTARVTDQNLLHIRFDAAGNVAAVNQGDESMVVAINPVKDKTPTLGRKRSFFDELFGNIGVFNSGALGDTGPSQ